MRRKQLGLTLKDKKLINDWLHFIQMDTTNINNKARRPIESFFNEEVLEYPLKVYWWNKGKNEEPFSSNGKTKRPKPLPDPSQIDESQILWMNELLVVRRHWVLIKDIQRHLLKKLKDITELMFRAEYRTSIDTYKIMYGFEVGEYSPRGNIFDGFIEGYTIWHLPIVSSPEEWAEYIFMNIMSHIPLEKMKKCLYCNHYFFEGRKDKKCCSNLCASRANMERKKIIKAKNSQAINSRNDSYPK